MLAGRSGSAANSPNLPANSITSCAQTTSRAPRSAISIWVPADATDVKTAQWKDLTPSDGNPDLTQATLVLKKDAVYNVELQFLDETKTPVGNVTEEIEERANYHLVCYNPASGLNLTVLRTDLDGNTPALQLGLKSKFTTAAISTGNLQVSLHHQPSGKNGTDCSLGTTDADVNFTVNIQ